MSIRYSFIIVLLVALAATTTAFMPSISPVLSTRQQSARTISSSSSSTSYSSSTQLAERRWNFNEGQSPWGLKTNAEIWNGRVAQVAFVIVFLQELIQGKGVIQGVSEGDPVNLAILGAVVVTTIGLTGFLALQGDDDYVNKD